MTLYSVLYFVIRTGLRRHRLLLVSSFQPTDLNCVLVSVLRLETRVDKIRKFNLTNDSTWLDWLQFSGQLESVSRLRKLRASVTGELCASLAWGHWRSESILFNYEIIRLDSILSDSTIVHFFRKDFGPWAMSSTQTQTNKWLRNLEATSHDQRIGIEITNVVMIFPTSTFVSLKLQLPLPLPLTMFQLFVISTFIFRSLRLQLQPYCILALALGFARMFPPPKNQSKQQQPDSAASLVAAPSPADACASPTQVPATPPSAIAKAHAGQGHLGNGQWVDYLFRSGDDIRSCSSRSIRAEQSRCDLMPKLTHSHIRTNKQTRIVDHWRLDIYDVFFLDCVGLGLLTGGDDGETCVNCLEQVKLVELCNKHRLKNHCAKCSKRHRSICSSSSDAGMTHWFKGLVKSDIEYRKVMANHESVTGPDIQRGAAGAKVKGKFDLLECLVWTVEWTNIFSSRVEAESRLTWWCIHGEMVSCGF